ncbi:MAG: hypothetical protein NZ750_13785 [Anaerolineae bacterium]|nr:hypothetical protein [Anaerolineae bacterium]MDW8172871.1 hypothetical protein [Anaerolineae bacterium]
MSVFGLLIGLALLVALVLALAWPFFVPPQPSLDDQLERQRQRAQAYYERILTNIRDLDEDFQTGKIDQAEYQAEREVWAARGVVVLGLLDDLSRRQAFTDLGADAAHIDAAIEAAVQARRQEA